MKKLTALICCAMLAASSAAEVPRGIEFLLMPNRLNVAISRAKYAAYLLYSPALLDDLPRGPQGLAQQGVCAQVDHAHRQVVAGLPPAVDELQLCVGRCSHCIVCHHVCTRSRGGVACTAR